MNLNQILRLKRPLIVLDLETTAKDPAVARIVEIGMRIHWPVANSVTSHRTLVNPGIQIPQYAIDAHGLTNELFESGDACASCRMTRDAHPTETCQEFKPIPRFADIAAEFYKGLSAADFAGYHVKYDLRTLRAEFARCKYQFDYSGAAIIDVLRLWQILEPRTLSDAVEHFLHRKHETAHTALGDVQETEDVLIAQLTTHKMCATLPRDLKELNEKCWPNQIDTDGKFVFIEGVPSFNFGSHHGSPMAKHADYLQWMRDKGKFSPEVQRIVTAALAGKFPEAKDTTDVG